MSEYASAEAFTISNIRIGRRAIEMIKLNKKRIDRSFGDDLCFQIHMEYSNGRIFRVVIFVNHATFVDQDC